MTHFGGMTAEKELNAAKKNERWEIIYDWLDSSQSRWKFG
jgi:hypothetical protein